MTFAEMMDQVKAALGDPLPTGITVPWIKTNLNDVALELANETRCIADVNTESSIANQMKYDMPSDWLHLTAMGFISDRLKRLTWMSYGDFFGLNPYTGTPLNYAWRDDAVYLRPHPGSDASSTLIDNPTGLPQGATTLDVVSTSGFGSRGRLYVDESEKEEVIEYTSTSATQFKGLRRGMEGTSDVGHLNGASIVERDIWFFYYRKPTTLSADSDISEVPSQFHHIVALGCIARAKDFLGWPDKVAAEGKYQDGIRNMRKKMNARVSDGSRTLGPPDTGRRLFIPYPGWYSEDLTA